MRKIKELLNRLYMSLEGRLSICPTCDEYRTIFKGVRCGFCQWYLETPGKMPDKPTKAVEPEPERPTRFVFICADETAFEFPTDHPEINAGGIGGFAYEYICEDSSRMPYHFKQFAIADERNRPSVKDHRTI